MDNADETIRAAQLQVQYAEMTVRRIRVFLERYARIPFDIQGFTRHADSKH